MNIVVLVPVAHHPDRAVRRQPADGDAGSQSVQSGPTASCRRRHRSSSILFLAVIFGMIVGSLTTWFTQGKYRKRARNEAHEAVKWHAEADKHTTPAPKPSPHRRCFRPPPNNSVQLFAAARAVTAVLKSAKNCVGELLRRWSPPAAIRVVPACRRFRPWPRRSEWSPSPSSLRTHIRAALGKTGNAALALAGDRVALRRV